MTERASDRPDSTTLRRRRRRLTLAILGVLLFALIVVAFIVRRGIVDSATRPVSYVQIQSPAPGSHLPAHDEINVVMAVHELTAVSRYELWVNGRLTRYREASASAPLETLNRFGWRPSAAGPHVLVARALDGRGRVRSSNPVVVEAVSLPRPSPIDIVVESRPGDTLESIAIALKVSPGDLYRANPGIPQPPPPGTAIKVSVPRDRIPSGYGGDDADARSASVSAKRPLSPPPRGVGEGRAEGVSRVPRDWWLSVSRAFGSDPPASPAELVAESTGACGIRLKWTDNSTAEKYFRIERSQAGQRARTIATVQRNHQWARLTYDDRVTLGGHYEYTVSAVNNGGTAPSPIAVIDIPDRECKTQSLVASGASTLLQLEAIDLATTNNFDRVYCLLALGELQTERRIPERNDVFLEPDGPGWDVAKHAAGISRFVVAVPQRSVQVRLTCRGMRGQEDFDLGTWSREHPADEWNGAVLRGVTDGFRVSYRLEPFENWPTWRELMLDFTIPAPSGVRLAIDGDDVARVACDARANFAGGNAAYAGEGVLGRWACLEIVDQMLIWDWSPTDTVSREDVTGFRIFINREVGGSDRFRILSSADWHEIGASGSVTQIFPVEKPGCGRTFAYRVQAFIAGDPSRESLLSSNYFFSGPPCPAEQRRALVEVTLETLTIEDSKDVDGFEYLCFFCREDRVQEGYGQILVGAFTESWVGKITEFVLGGDLCVGLTAGLFPDIPDFGLINVCPTDSLFNISDATLDLGTQVHLKKCDIPEADRILECERRAVGQNRTTLEVRHLSEIRVQIVMMDQDGATGDDLWCATNPGSEGHLSIDDWATADFTMTLSNDRFRSGNDDLYNYDSDQDARCSLRVRFRGRGEVRR